MKYYVTNVSTSHYSSSKVSIKPATEVEVGKDVYNYLNDVYGASGKFTFRTDKPKKETKATKEIKPKKETKPKK